MLNILLAAIGIIGGAILWRLGGNGYKFCRSFVLPIFLAALKFVISGFNPISLLYAPALMALLAIFSYGLSSPIHILVVLLFGGKGADGNYLPVEIVTRAICGFFWSLAAIAFVVAGGSVLNMIGYTAFFTVANAIFGTNKNVTISECGCGGSCATSLLV